MKTKKKRKYSIWFIIGVFGLIFFITGSVNGCRELLNHKIVTISLANYMEKYPSGSKLELTDCKIENGISVEVTKRKRKSTRERTTDRYYLLKSKKEISQPKVYVFVNDDEVGIGNSNPSKEFEEQTLDKMDFMI